MVNEKEFLELLQTAIRENRLKLPTLPEVALQVREAVESEKASAADIATIVARDAALSARLLQVVNGPLYRGRNVINNIQMAVTRLGRNLVRNLVVSLVMQQIYQATSDVTDKRLRQLWEHSVQVAAISRVLAQRPLLSDQAMLAGLIHNIGALPLLVLAEDVPELLDNESVLDQLLDKLSPVVGSQILQSWNFPDTLVAVAAHHQDIYHEGGLEPDYVDVVLVARLQTLMGTDHPLAKADWSRVPAFAKLGFEPQVSVVDIEGKAEEVSDAQQMLLG